MFDKWLKKFEHISHWNSFFPVCLHICACRLLNWSYDALHKSHEYFFSPWFAFTVSWYFTCRLKSPVTFFKQIGQIGPISFDVNFFSSLTWTSECRCKLDFLLKHLSHNSHLNGWLVLCVAMCLVLVDDSVNAFRQISHLYRFSPGQMKKKIIENQPHQPSIGMTINHKPVWIRVWPKRLLELAKFLWHTLQVCNFP